MKLMCLELLLGGSFNIDIITASPGHSHKKTGDR